jgi:hypothetical protein
MSRKQHVDAAIDDRVGIQAPGRTGSARLALRPDHAARACATAQNKPAR